MPSLIESSAQRIPNVSRQLIRDRPASPWPACSYRSWEQSSPSCRRLTSIGRPLIHARQSPQL
jgi:hypothetical protein